MFYFWSISNYSHKIIFGKLRNYCMQTIYILKLFFLQFFQKKSNRHHLEKKKIKFIKFATLEGFQPPACKLFIFLVAFSFLLFIFIFTFSRGIISINTKWGLDPYSFLKKKKIATLCYICNQLRDY